MEQCGYSFVTAHYGFSKEERLLAQALREQPGQGVSVVLSSDRTTLVVSGQHDNSGIGAVWTYALADTCAVCVPGTWSTVSRARSSATCVSCTVGSYCTGGSAIALCPEGTFGATPGLASVGGVQLVLLDPLVREE